MASIDGILAAEPPAFGRAVQAIIAGDARTLHAELAAVSDLVRTRSSSPHHATLLHYVSANGVESELQGPVANADEIAALLIAAGAEINAGCDAYGWTDTLGLVV